MEEKNKNSAIEKTEEIAQKASKKPTKKGAKRVKTQNQTAENQREKVAEDKKEARLAKQKERKKAQKQRLQKREEKRRLALKKREEKQKAMLERREAIRQKRQELRDKRLAEKQARQAQIAQKRLERHELREQKKREKSRGVGGWLAAVISLSCAVLVLGGLLAFTVFTPMDEYLAVSTREQQSFYDLVGYVDAIDVNLSKLVVSNDDENRQKLLGDVRVQSNLAIESISSMALKDEDKFYTTKFINQIGDFSKYLSEKLIDGEKLSKEDIETLKSMHEINSALRNSLSELSSQIDENYDFQSLFEGKESDVIISKFNELESNAIDYPHMIYDGAFSDGTEAKVALFVDDLEVVNQKEAEDVFRKFFADYNLQNVELVGETVGKVIETYNFEAQDENGVTLTAQITKKGAKLAEFNYFKDCDEELITLEKCRELADSFLEKVGYKSVKAVWTADSGNVITINYASVYNGVICYLDLIKVNVCRERGIVSGIEASSYIYNHTDREVKKAEVALSDVKQKVSSEIEIESCRLAIIPKGEGKEVLAYEFTGTSNGSTYYVYIDAITGREVDIFKVIETTEGLLLM